MSVPAARCMSSLSLALDRPCSPLARPGAKQEQLAEVGSAVPPRSVLSKSVYLYAHVDARPFGGFPTCSEQCGALEIASRLGVSRSWVYNALDFRWFDVEGPFSILFGWLGARHGSNQAGRKEGRRAGRKQRERRKEQKYRTKERKKNSFLFCLGPGRIRFCVKLLENCISRVSDASSCWGIPLCRVLFCVKLVLAGQCFVAGSWATPVCRVLV